MTILIDNGHGKNTAGNCSPDGRIKEYAWAREIAARLHTELKARGYDARLLTPEENDISIPVRCSRTNAVCSEVGTKNCLLVSVHINAAGNGDWNTARGFSVFCSKNASSNSKTCARGFTSLAKARGMLGNRSVPADGYWTWSWTKADIGILKNTACPAVLTENFFMDNKDDVEYLLSEAGKAEVVQLHVDVIAAYCDAKGGVR